MMFYDEQLATNPRYVNMIRGKRVYPCPCCKERNRLTRFEISLGHTCRVCSAADEMGFY